MLDKICNTDFIVCFGLVTALILAIYSERNDIALQLSAGLVGWLGKSKI